MYTSGSVNFKNSNGEIDNYEGWKKEPDEDPSIDHSHRSQDPFRALDDDILRKEGAPLAAAWEKEHPYTIEDYAKDCSKDYYKHYDDFHSTEDFIETGNRIADAVPEDADLINSILKCVDCNKGYTNYRDMINAVRTAISNGTSKATITFAKMMQSEAYRIYGDTHKKAESMNMNAFDRLCESIYKESN